MQTKVSYETSYKAPLIRKTRLKPPLDNLSIVKFWNLQNRVYPNCTGGAFRAWHKGSDWIDIHIEENGFYLLQMISQDKKEHRSFVAREVNTVHQVLG